jgi:PPOX class probable FMN-dependent enzyme
MVSTAGFTSTITTLDELRAVVAEPHQLARDKDVGLLDEHCQAFIARSPFLLLATANAAGQCDVSPKGDVPGFVQVLGERTMVIPDRPGNNRLDSLSNIIENPHAGVLFIIPGVEWTLRVNGRATIVRDEDVLERCAVGGKRPLLGIAIDVEEAYHHCPKCFLRSKVWDTDEWMQKDEQPSFAAILKRQTQLNDVPVEVIEKALDESHKKLY